MFWIGFGTGVSAAFLVMIFGMSALAWSVSKERGAAARDGGKILDRWQEANDLLRERNAVNERIAEALERRGYPHGAERPMKGEE